MNLTHVYNKLTFDFLAVIDLEFFKEFVRHRNQSLLGPGQEPVNCASREERRELLCSYSEFGRNWGEAKDSVQVIFATVNEVVPQESGVRIFTLCTSFFHVNRLLLKWDKISVFFKEEAGDFTSSQHGVDSFKEGFRLNLSIGENKGNSTTLRTRNAVELFNVFFELGITVVLVKSDLEEELSADEGRKFGERLFT